VARFRIIVIKMKFNVRVVGAVVGIVLAASACGSTKTVAAPGPMVSVTPTVTATASPASQRDTADPKNAQNFVQFSLSTKGEPQVYVLAYADSGAVNVHSFSETEHPTVSAPAYSQLLVGTYVTVHCFEHGDTVANDVGRSSDVWYYISFNENIDGFTSSVFIDLGSGNTSWVVPACPVGFGVDPNVSAEPAS
jgi:hypothetical protein